MKWFPLLFLLFLTVASDAQTAQWRGPGRNGIYPDTGLLKSWPETGPPLLLQINNIGRGFSSAVATNDRIFVTGLKDSLDMLMAFDFSGALIWKRSFGPAWNESVPDSRCTPLIENDRIYVLSGRDNLVCFDTSHGEKIWSVDVHEEYGSHWDMFGVSESLLLVDDKVICTPGGDSTTIIALDKMTGDLVWKSRSIGGQRSNASPALFVNDTLGLRFIISMTRTHTFAVDPDNGEILWTYHYSYLGKDDENMTIQANTPLFHNDEILLSSGWDYKTVMLEVSADGLSVSEKYIDRTLDNQNHGLVLLDGYVYGSNFLTRHFGKWVCMNWDTGEIMWVTEWQNKGPVISADGMLYIYDDKQGNVGLVRPNPDKFELVSSFRVTEGSGAHWARPSIYGGRLFIRHGATLLVYDLRA
ncbi:MAG: PQQ-like beta-propeller repeat protein [Bacteroidales bacterium]|nr:PQQ-like beta-propeller repeat protein [Bacteroidales bacterium]